HAVADAEHRDAELEQLAAAHGRPRPVDRLRAAGQDEPDRVALADLLLRHVERVHLAVDAVLAHAPRDELRVLAAEVEDEDGLVLMLGHAERFPSRLWWREGVDVRAQFLTARLRA